MNDIYESDIEELTISLLKENGYSYCNTADGLTPDNRILRVSNLKAGKYQLVIGSNT